MKRLLCLVPCLLLVACGSDNNSNNSSVDDGSNAAAQAASESADNAGSGSSAVAGQGDQAIKTASTAFNSTFDLDGCTCVVNGNFTVVSGAVALNANFSVDPNTCTMGRVFSGSESIDANITTTNRTLSIVADMNMTLRSTDFVTITTLASDAPTYAGVGSGDPSGGATTFTANINEHRQRHTAKGVAVYDMNITTAAATPLVITDAYTQSVLHARNVNGAVTVHHNLDKYTATHTFKNVQRTFGSCNCPAAGEIDQVVSLDSGNAAGTGSYTKVYTFTGCGTGTFVVQSSTASSVAATGSSASGNFVWDSCE